MADADALGFEPDVLVNCAGLWVLGPFLEAGLERQLAMIHLNVVALVGLTGTYLPRMIARGGGVVVNVGSTAAFQPMPYFAVYGATKACVVAFGEALWAEVHAAGIRAVTICPGLVFTPPPGEPSLNASGIKRLIRRRFPTPEMVVAASLDAVDADKPLVVKRLAAGRVLCIAAAALVATLSRRRRMFVYERLNRWLLQGR